MRNKKMDTKRKSEKQFQKEKGITLVALVVTIVVLLILAGITITALFSENGIIKKAQEAAKATENDQAYTAQGLDSLADQIGSELGQGSKAGFNKTKGVNSPKLGEGMVPVRWDETEKSWYVCKEDNTDGWYEYGTTENNRNWANVMLKDGLTLEDGTDVNTKTNEELAGKKVATLGSMFVWIPRYAYKMESVAPTVTTTTDENGVETQTVTDPGRGYHTNVAGTIEIAFLQGTTDTPADSTKNIVEYNSTTTENYTRFPNGYVVHPAFNYGQRISGIWVAKFEASKVGATTDITNESAANNNKADIQIQVKPNVTSLRYINVSNIYTNCLNYKTNLNSHMMKNTEWGAVAYFNQSSYGRNGEEIGQNQCKTYITGSGPATDGTAYEYDGTTFAGTYDYTSTQGKLASSTKNVTGIYDLSGGATEYVAAYMKGANAANAGNLINGAEKTKDVYEIGETVGNALSNYNANKSKYGDAIWETSSTTANSASYNSWNGGGSYFPVSGNRCFHRGGNATDTGTNAGSFSFFRINGHALVVNGFRPVLVVL